MADKVTAAKVVVGMDETRWYLGGLKEAHDRWLCSNEEAVDRLVAALDAALKLHQGHLAEDYPETPRFCGVCGEWCPCPTYQAISRALLGEEAHAASQQDTEASPPPTS